MRNYVVIAALLLAAPLSAQDNTVITVNDTTVVNIFDNDSTFINVTLSDSAMAAAIDRLQASLDSAVAVLNQCDRCQGGGEPTIIQVGRPLLIIALSVLGLRKLGQIVTALENKEHEPEEPEEEEEPKEPDYGEGSER